MLKYRCIWLILRSILKKRLRKNTTEKRIHVGFDSLLQRVSEALIITWQKLSFVQIDFV